jgi:hypothetical protein
MKRKMSNDPLGPHAPLPTGEPFWLLRVVRFAWTAQPGVAGAKNRKNTGGRLGTQLAAQSLNMHIQGPRSGAVPITPDCLQQVRTLKATTGVLLQNGQQLGLLPGEPDRNAGRLGSLTRRVR